VKKAVKKVGNVRTKVEKRLAGLFVEVELRELWSEGAEA
jgi:hypothetical protein